MLYNSLKYLHILSASLLIGGHLFLMIILPKIRHLITIQTLKSLIYICFFALLGIICTGVALVDIALIEYSDFWIKHALIVLVIYILLLGFLHKLVNNRLLWCRLLWWFSWLLLHIILCLMIFKPEF